MNIKGRCTKWTGVLKTKKFSIHISQKFTRQGGMIVPLGDGTGDLSALEIFLIHLTW